MPGKWVSYPELVRRATSPQGYDYIIYNEGNYVVAKNGRTGRVDIKSDDLSEVLSEALANSKGRIHILAGEYDAYTPLDLPVSDSSGYPSNFGWIIEGDSSYSASARGTIINLHDGITWWKWKESANGYGYYTQTTIRNLTFKGTGSETVFDYEEPTNGGSYPEVVYENLWFSNVAKAIRHAGFRITASRLQARNITDQAFYFVVYPGSIADLDRITVVSQTSSNFAIEVKGNGTTYARHLDAESCTNGIYFYTYRRGMLVHPYTEGCSDVGIQVAGLDVMVIHPLVASGKLVLGRDDSDSANFKVYLSGYNIPPDGIEIYRLYDAEIYAGYTGPSLKDKITIHSGANIRIIGRGWQNSGTATFSGDGTTTQFKIEHGLVSTPSKVLVTPMSADAAGDFYVTADDTYIYVNYKTAPPSGTNNIKLSWHAEV